MSSKQNQSEGQMTDKALWLSVRSEFYPGDSGVIKSRQQRDNMLLQTIATNVEIAEPVPVSSHRLFVGKLIVFAKTSMMLLAKPWIKICLGRQQAINEQIMELASNVLEMKMKIQYLEERLHSLANSEKK